MATSPPPSPGPPVLLYDEPPPASPTLPSGWRARQGFVLPATPWDLSARRVVAVGTVDGESTAAAALQALARGVGLAIAVTVEGDVRHRLLEDVHRLGSVEAPATGTGLRAGDADLLDALAAGATISEAATQVHVSVRTANRRLAEIRAHFEVATTAEAVTRWAAGPDSR